MVFGLQPYLDNLIFMSKLNAAERSRKTSSIGNMIHTIKSGRRMRVKTKSSHRNNIIQHIFHPDYILFDWEFFSTEVEFE